MEEGTLNQFDFPQMRSALISLLLRKLFSIVIRAVSTALADVFRFTRFGMRTVLVLYSCGSAGVLAQEYLRTLVLQKYIIPNRAELFGSERI